MTIEAQITISKEEKRIYVSQGSSTFAFGYESHPDNGEEYRVYDVQLGDWSRFFGSWAAAIGFCTNRTNAHLRLLEQEDEALGTHH